MQVETVSGEMVRLVMGKDLRAARQALNWTQEQMAHSMGVSHTTIYRWERMAVFNPVELDRFDKWATALRAAKARGENITPPRLNTGKKLGRPFKGRVIRGVICPGVPATGYDGPPMPEPRLVMDKPGTTQRAFIFPPFSAFLSMRDSWLVTICDTAKADKDGCNEILEEQRFGDYYEALFHCESLGFENPANKLVDEA